MQFTSDAKKVVVTLKSGAETDRDTAAVQERLVRSVGIPGEWDAKEWAANYRVTGIEDGVDGSRRVTIAMPEEVLTSDDYVGHEVQNLGRVFIRNSANHHRWLLYPQRERRLVHEDGRLFAHVGRSQLIPGLLDWTEITMSEKQNYT